MRRLVAVSCIVGMSVLVAALLQAATKVLSIYPEQLKDWTGYPNAPVQFEGGYLLARGVRFVYPFKLPVGAKVTQLKAWVNVPASPWPAIICLHRVKDGFDYNPRTDDLAAVDIVEAGYPHQWTQLDDPADGPAPARIAAGYRSYLRVEPFESEGVKLRMIQIVYTTP